MNKYKEKARFGEDKFLKEDEEYLLKESRPVKEASIKKLNKKKMNQFIEDILTNKRLTSVLYATNAKIEIKTYLRTKKNLQRSEDKVKNDYETSYLVRKQNFREAYYQMRKEIDNYKIEKENHKNFLTQSNYQKYLTFKKLDCEKNLGNKTARTTRIQGFERAYASVENKLNSVKKSKELKTITNNSNNNRCVTENNLQKIILPEIKLNIKDVYSRLYNNSVLVTPVYKNNFYRFLSKEKAQAGIKAKKQKIKFNIKNVLNNTNGKEFTVETNDETISKCLIKYSGGPENIQFLNEKKFNEKQKFDKSNEDYVDFYDLVEKNTGNSYLHKAVIDNYPEIVKYILDKGADVNKQNDNGDTALHIAAKNDNVEIIELLIKNKAALDIPNKEGVIPFELFSPDVKKEFGFGKTTIVNPARNYN